MLISHSNSTMLQINCSEIIEPNYNLLDIWDNWSKHNILSLKMQQLSPNFVNQKLEKQQRTNFKSGTLRLSVHSWLLTKESETKTKRQSVTEHVQLTKTPLLVRSGSTQQGHHHNGDQVARRPRPHDVLNLWSPIYDPYVWGTWGSGWANSVACRTRVFLLAPHWYIWSISYRLLAPKAFPSVSPRYDDKYRSRSYRFVERQ